MTMKVSGPMFEPAQSTYWQAVTCDRCRVGRDGAHYNTFGCRDENGMVALRTMFPNGEADEYNAVLFSTSGVHGMYTTIEEAEAEFLRGNKDEDGEDVTPYVTFLIVHPRIVCLRYGNCEPQSAEDFAWLKQLRASSWKVFGEIGRSEEPEAVDAVDPQAPLRESPPRATETLPTASRGGGDTRPPRQADQEIREP
jgi:hypothetical protein